MPVLVPNSEYQSSNASIQFTLDGCDIGYLTYRVKISPNGTIPSKGLRLYFYLNCGRSDVAFSNYGYSQWEVVDTISYMNANQTINSQTISHPPMVTSEYDPFYHLKFTTCVVVTNSLAISSYSEQSLQFNFATPSGLEFMLNYVGEPIPYGYTNSESTTYEKNGGNIVAVFDYRHSYSYRKIRNSYAELSVSHGIVAEVLVGSVWKLWSGTTGKSPQHPFQGEFNGYRKASNSVFVVPTYKKCTSIFLRQNVDGVVDSDITQNTTSDLYETNNATLKLSGDYMSNAKRILLTFDTTPLIQANRTPEYAELFGFVYSYSAGSTNYVTDYISITPYRTNAPEWYKNTANMVRSITEPFRDTAYPLTAQRGLSSWGVSNRWMRFQSFSNLNLGLQQWLSEIKSGTRNERGIALDFHNTSVINTNQPQFSSKEGTGLAVNGEVYKGFFITYSMGVRIPLITNLPIRYAVVDADPISLDLDGRPTNQYAFLDILLTKDQTGAFDVIGYVATNAFDSADLANVGLVSGVTSNDEWVVTSKVIQNGLIKMRVTLKTDSLVTPYASNHTALISATDQDVDISGDITNYALTFNTPSFFGTDPAIVNHSVNFAFSEPNPFDYNVIGGGASIIMTATHDDDTAWLAMIEPITIVGTEWTATYIGFSTNRKELYYRIESVGNLSIGLHSASIIAFDSVHIGNVTHRYNGTIQTPTFNFSTLADLAIIFTFYDYLPQEITNGVKRVYFKCVREDNSVFDSTYGVVTLVNGGGSWELIESSITLQNNAREIHGYVEYIGSPIIVGSYSFRLNGYDENDMLGNVQKYIGFAVSPTFTIEVVNTEVIPEDVIDLMNECLDIQMPVKGTRRLVNLDESIPEVYKGTDVEAFVHSIQNSLNEAYTGTNLTSYATNPEMQYLFFNEDETPISDADARTRFNEEEYSKRLAISELRSVQYQSVLEMIERLGTLSDSGKIPFQLLRYMALDMGYDFGINIVRNGVTSKSKRYLRFLVENLSTIFASKGTKDGLRGFIHAFGGLVSVHYGWTTDYFSDWKYSNEADLKDSDGVTIPPHEQIPFTQNSQREFIPNGYFLTPHFKLEINVTEIIDTDEDGVEELFKNIKKAIEWHKPIQCVVDELKLNLDVKPTGIYIKGAVVRDWSDI